jgi:hypothetical protein
MARVAYITVVDIGRFFARDLSQGVHQGKCFQAIFYLDASTWGFLPYSIVFWALVLLLVGHRFGVRWLRLAQKWGVLMGVLNFAIVKPLKIEVNPTGLQRN